jgi:hypothetical protein
MHFYFEDLVGKNLTQHLTCGSGLEVKTVSITDGLLGISEVRR